jgi:hypothetical protein
MIKDYGLLMRGESEENKIIMMIIDGVRSSESRK